MGIKISNLPMATESKVGDIFPIVQDGETKQIAQSTILQNVNSDIVGINNEIDRLDNKIDDATARFTAPLSYKGEVQTIQDLPSGASAGDIYNVISENKNYIWNGTEWVVYAQTIDFTNIENQIKTTLETEETSSIEITNIAGVNGKISITDGNTTQETRSGKNKLNIDNLSSGTKNSLTLTKNIDGTITLNGTVSGGDANFDFAIPSIVATSSYKIQIYHISGSFTNNYVSSYIATDNTFANYKLVATPSDIGNSNTSLNATTYSYMRIKISNGVVCNNLVIGIQVVEGTETSYEQYGVSPSPDYPSEIHNVGDNVNLYNGSQNRNITSQTVIADINISEINNLTFSADFINNTNIGGAVYFDDGVGNRIITLNIVNDQKIELSANTSNYTRVRVVVSGNSSGYNFDFNNIKLEEGTQATPYSPYNCGNANIEVSNKNLLNPEKIVKDTNNSYVYITDGYIRFNTGRDQDGKMKIIPECIKENTAYTFKAIVKSGVTTTNAIKFGVHYTDGTYAELFTTGDITDTNERTLIATTNASKTLSYISNTDTWRKEAYLKIEGSMLLEGSYTAQTIPSYVPHQSQLITFPFTEGQRMYLGDYLASDGIHHVRKQVVFNGTENWSVHGSLASWFYITTLPNNPYINNSQNNFALCNVASQIKYTEITSIQDNQFGIGTSNNNLRVVFKNTNYSTTEQFKTYLATQYSNGTPVILEYELAEEEIEPFTPEQEEAYWDLQHCLMYKDYTKIECIDETKCKFKVEYYYGNELNETYAKRLDNILETFYPVGSIYMTVSPIYPGKIFGGEWEEWAGGRVPVGITTDIADFDTVEKTGGEKDHVLTIDEMPSHTHLLDNGDNNVVADGSTGTSADLSGGGSAYVKTKIASAGGGLKHNNLQPYITCYFWKRIS